MYDAANTSQVLDSERYILEKQLDGLGEEAADLGDNDEYYDQIEIDGDGYNDNE